MDEWELLFATLPPDALGDDRDFRRQDGYPGQAFAEELQRQYGQELRKDVDLAQDFYRALCNNIWIGTGPESSEQQLAYTWRAAGELIAEVRSASGCPTEDYMDYYCLGGEGQVSPEVEQLLNNLGYQRQE